MAELKFETDAPMAEHLAVSDAEIKKFDAWFQKYQVEHGAEEPQPLVNSERAILKTYLYYKLRGSNGS